MEQKITGLLRSRSSCKGQLTRLEKELQAQGDVADELKNSQWLARLARIKASYKEKQDALLELFTEEQYALDVQSDERFTTQAEALQELLELPKMEIRLKQEVTPLGSLTSNSPSVVRGGGARIKLPELKLRSFDGTYSEWQAYRDMFEAMIGQTELSEVQKLQYLRSTLVGEPLDLIKALPITSDNFSISWGILESRYDDKGNIASSIMQRLFGMQQTVRSGSNLRNIATVTTEVTRGLQALGSYWNSIDPLIIFAVNQTLDCETKYQWEREQQTKQEPTIEQYINFLVGQAKALENSAEIRKERRDNRDQFNKGHEYQRSRRALMFSNSCVICTESHELIDCSAFKNMQALERRQMVSKSELCFRCLKPNHMARKCDSHFKCEHCQKGHHTLLHLEDRDSRQNNHCADSASAATLPILIVTAQANGGVLTSMRVLLDTGSQLNLMTEASAQRLRVPRERSMLTVKGVGDKKGILARGRCWVNLTKDSVSLRTPFEILPKIGPGFDMILGAEYVARVLSGSTVSFAQGSHHLQTIFGPVMIGNTLRSSMAMCATTGSGDTRNVCEILQKFWEVEDIQGVRQDMWTEEEQMCEEHYKTNTVTIADGHIQVRLPLLREAGSIGRTRGRAICQQKSLELRLAKNKELALSYIDFMEEYETLGHMKKVPEHEITCYHMPHHPVLRNDSLTTKLRVVFNASADPDDTGTSLNKASAVGPTIQDDLLTIVLRFRFHRVGLTADIEKMFRQIRVDERDWPLQCIVWRSCKDDKIQDYYMTTVTYGTASAPFIACRSLQYIADQQQHAFKKAADIARRDFYVDDLTSGAETEKEARDLVSSLNCMFQKYHIHLRKWTCSHGNVLEGLDSKDTKDGLVLLTRGETPPGKTLGIGWDAQNDLLGLQFSDETSDRLTKRGILSHLAAVYDPPRPYLAHNGAR